MKRAELTETIRKKALELGYVDVGFTTLDDFDGYEKELKERKGYKFFSDRGLSKTAKPKQRYPSAKSVISLVDSYGNIDFPEVLANSIGRAYLARSYASLGKGINSQRHILFKDFLHGLGINTFDEPGFFQLPDRAVAARAGVVTYGKNNFAYAGKYGSFIILTSVIIDAEPNCQTHKPRRDCPEGCRLCIEACPTHALNEQGHLDPERCVLFNNIFPDILLNTEVRGLIGMRIHGCDTCQLVCPRNRHILNAPKVKDPLLEEIAEVFDLEKMLCGDEEYYRKAVTPLISPYFEDKERHRRNAAVAMGNSNMTNYLPALQAASKHDPSSLVRKAAEWAIGRLGSAK
ncbi:MAG: epoxyqueuosine reductase [Dethiobacteria bacterium]